MSSESIRNNELRTNALDGKLTFDQSRNRIIGRDEDGLARLLILANGSDFRMKISKVGLDVLTSDLQDLVFDSDNNLFKILDSGTASFASPNLIGSSSFVNVSHSLGYNPIVLAFVSFSPTGTAFPLPRLDVNSSGADAGKVRTEISFECVAGNTITFFQRDITAATNWTNYIRYYIVTETAN